MQKLLTFLAIFFCSGLNALGQTGTQLEKFTFLKGTWVFETAKAKISETWTWDKQSEWHGESYSISHSGDSTLLETIRIVNSGRDIFYIPTSNNSTIAFKLIPSNEGIFVFENNEHDFPQRIVYQIKSDDNLLAWIEGELEGRYKKIDFPYQRSDKD